MLKKLILGSLLHASLCQYAHAMCTGTVVQTPVRMLDGGTSSEYKKGEVTYFITQYTVESGRLYLCAWGGDCVDGDDVHLRKVLGVHGDPQNGHEIRENAYETDENCTLGHLEKN